MKRQFAIGAAVLGLCLAGCTVPAPPQRSTLSPVLAHGDEAQFCKSIAYLADAAEQSHVSYMAWLNKSGDQAAESAAQAIQTAKDYGPGSKPYNDFAGDKPDAWLLDDANGSDVQRHFELARRYKKAGNSAYRYHLLRALRPGEADFIANPEGVQFRFVREHVTGTQVWAVCAAHAECPSVGKPSEGVMPYCDQAWWPGTTVEQPRL